MTPEMAEFIGKTISPIIKSNDPMEMKEGTYMWVRVKFDVTAPFVEEERLVLMKRLKGGWLSYMNGCQTFAFGVECYRTTTKIAKCG